MEQGADGDRAGFHGNRVGFYGSEVISAVQDEEHFYGEDEDYDDLYNDVNVREGFYQSSLHRGEAAVGSFPRAEVNKRELPLVPLTPQIAGVLPEKVQIPSLAGNLQTGRTVSRSGEFTEPGFKGSINSSALARPLAPEGLIRPDLGQAWPRPGVIQPHQGGNAFESEGFPRQGTVFGNEGFHRQGVAVGGGSSANLSVTMNTSGKGGVEAGPSVGVRTNMNGAVSVIGGSSGGGGTTILFIGELHWWTTDADLEAELCKYGSVKEVRFFDEKASGKSNGYAQVEFYNPASAISCKEGMNGHIFNGRACVVALSSPLGVRKLGEAQVTRNQQGMVQGPSQSLLAQKGGRGAHVAGNFSRGGGGGSGGGNGVAGSGGNWGRGGMGNKGHVGNARHRAGPVGGRGIMGNGGMVAPPPPIFNPCGILGQGLDPAGYGVAMGRINSGYGGFPAGTASGAFPGILPSFPPVVAPHVNPAFFGRGMPISGVGMWPDPSMGGWGVEEQSSYGEDAASDQHYGEGGHGKDKGADRYWSGASERKHMRDKNTGHEQEWYERKQNEERNGGWDKDIELDWVRERETARKKETEIDIEMIEIGVQIIIGTRNMN